MSRPTIKAWIMLAVATFVVCGGAAAVVIFSEDRNPETLCLRGSERGQTIVLIDKTDLWNANQAERLERHILDILNDDMRQEEHLRVFAFGALIEPGFKERFTRCKPPDGRDCLGVFCNPKELKNRYDTRFLPPLQSELKTLKIATQGACSPIAEALFEVLSRKEIKSQRGPTRVVLISDMAQNTGLYTAFRGLNSCPGVTSRMDPDRDNGMLDFFDKRRAEMRLSDTTVVVFQLFPSGRPPDIGDRARRKWEDVFKLLGVTQRWERL